MTGNARNAGLPPTTATSALPTVFFTSTSTNLTTTALTTTFNTPSTPSNNTNSRTTTQKTEIPDVPKTSTPITLPPYLLYPVNKIPHSQLPLPVRTTNFFFIATAQNETELIDVISRTIPLPTVEFMYDFIYSHNKNLYNPIKTSDQSRALGFLCENLAKFFIIYDNPKVYPNNVHILYHIALFSMYLISDPHTSHCLFTNAASIEMMGEDDDDAESHAMMMDGLDDLNRFNMNGSTTLTPRIQSPLQSDNERWIVDALSNIIKSPHHTVQSAQPQYSAKKDEYVSKLLSPQGLPPNSNAVDPQLVHRIKMLKSTQTRITPMIQLVSALYSVLTNHISPVDPAKTPTPLTPVSNGPDSYTPSNFDISNDTILLLGTIVTFFIQLFQPFFLIQPNFSFYPYQYRIKTTNHIVYSTGNKNCDELSYTDEQLILLSFLLNLNVISAVMSIMDLFGTKSAFRSANTVNQQNRILLIEHCVYFLLTVDKFVNTISTTTLQYTSLIISWPDSIVKKGLHGKVSHYNVDMPPLTLTSCELIELYHQQICAGGRDTPRVGINTKSSDHLALHGINIITNLIGDLLSAAPQLHLPPPLDRPQSTSSSCSIINTTSSDLDYIPHECYYLFPSLLPLMQDKSEVAASGSGNTPLFHYFSQQTIEWHAAQYQTRWLLLDWLYVLLHKLITLSPITHITTQSTSSQLPLQLLMSIYHLHSQDLLPLQMINDVIIKNKKKRLAHAYRLLFSGLNTTTCNAENTSRGNVFLLMIQSFCTELSLNQPIIYDHTGADGNAIMISPTINMFNQFNENDIFLDNSNTSSEADDIIEDIITPRRQSQSSTGTVHSNFSHKYSTGSTNTLHSVNKSSPRRILSNIIFFLQNLSNDLILPTSQITNKINTVLSSLTHPSSSTSIRDTQQSVTGCSSGGVSGGKRDNTDDELIDITPYLQQKNNILNSYNKTYVHSTPFHPRYSSRTLNNNTSTSIQHSTGVTTGSNPTQKGKLQNLQRPQNQIYETIFSPNNLYKLPPLCTENVVLTPTIYTSVFPCIVPDPLRYSSSQQSQGANSRSNNNIIITSPTYEDGVDESTEFEIPLYPYSITLYQEYVISSRLKNLFLAVNAIQHVITILHLFIDNNDTLTLQEKGVVPVAGNYGEEKEVIIVLLLLLLQVSLSFKQTGLLISYDKLLQLSSFEHANNSITDLSGGNGKRNFKDSTNYSNNPSTILSNDFTPNNVTESRSNASNTISITTTLLELCFQIRSSFEHLTTLILNSFISYTSTQHFITFVQYRQLLGLCYSYQYDLKQKMIRYSNKKILSASKKRQNPSLPLSETDDDDQPVFLRLPTAIRDKQAKSRQQEVPEENDKNHIHEKVVGYSLQDYIIYLFANNETNLDIKSDDQPSDQTVNTNKKDKKSIINNNFAQLSNNPGQIYTQFNKFYTLFSNPKSNNNNNPQLYTLLLDLFPLYLSSILQTFNSSPVVVFSTVKLLDNLTAPLLSVLPHSLHGNDVYSELRFHYHKIKYISLTIDAEQQQFISAQQHVASKSPIAKDETSSSATSTTANLPPGASFFFQFLAYIQLQTDTNNTNFPLASQFSLSPSTIEADDEVDGTNPPVHLYRNNVNSRNRNVVHLNNDIISPRHALQWLYTLDFIMRTSFIPQLLSITMQYSTFFSLIFVNLGILHRFILFSRHNILAALSHELISIIYTISQQWLSRESVYVLKYAVSLCLLHRETILSYNSVENNYLNNAIMSLTHSIVGSVGNISMHVLTTNNSSQIDPITGGPMALNSITSTTRGSVSHQISQMLPQSASINTANISAANNEIDYAQSNDYHTSLMNSTDVYNIDFLFDALKVDNVSLKVLQSINHPFLSFLNLEENGISSVAPVGLGGSDTLNNNDSTGDLSAPQAMLNPNIAKTLALVDYQHHRHGVSLNAAKAAIILAPYINAIPLTTLTYRIMKIMMLILSFNHAIITPNINNKTVKHNNLKNRASLEYEYHYHYKTEECNMVLDLPFTLDQLSHGNPSNNHLVPYLNQLPVSTPQDAQRNCPPSASPQPSPFISSRSYSQQDFLLKDDSTSLTELEPKEAEKLSSGISQLNLSKITNVFLSTHHIHPTALLPRHMLPVLNTHGIIQPQHLTTLLSAPTTTVTSACDSSSRAKPEKDLDRQLQIAIINDEINHPTTLISLLTLYPQHTASISTAITTFGHLVSKYHLYTQHQQQPLSEYQCLSERSQYPWFYTESDGQDFPESIVNNRVRYLITIDPVTLLHTSLHGMANVLYLVLDKFSHDTTLVNLALMEMIRIFSLTSEEILSNITNTLTQCPKYQQLLPPSQLSAKNKNTLAAEETNSDHDNQQSVINGYVIPDPLTSQEKPASTSTLAAEKVSLQNSADSCDEIFQTKAWYQQQHFKTNDVNRALAQFLMNNWKYEYTSSGIHLTKSYIFSLPRQFAVVLLSDQYPEVLNHHYFGQLHSMLTSPTPFFSNTEDGGISSINSHSISKHASGIPPNLSSLTPSNRRRLYLQRQQTLKKDGIAQLQNGTPKSSKESSQLDAQRCALFLPPTNRDGKPLLTPRNKSTLLNLDKPDISSLLSEQVTSSALAAQSNDHDEVIYKPIDLRPKLANDEVQYIKQTYYPTIFTELYSNSYTFIRNSDSKFANGSTHQQQSLDTQIEKSVIVEPKYPYTCLPFIWNEQSFELCLTYAPHDFTMYCENVTTNENSKNSINLGLDFDINQQDLSHLAETLTPHQFANIVTSLHQHPVMVNKMIDTTTKDVLENSQNSIEDDRDHAVNLLPLNPLEVNRTSSYILHLLLSPVEILSELLLGYPSLFAQNIHQSGLVGTFDHQLNLIPVTSPASLNYNSISMQYQHASMGHSGLGHSLQQQQASQNSVSAHGNTSNVTTNTGSQVADKSDISCDQSNRLLYLNEYNCNYTQLTFHSQIWNVLLTLFEQDRIQSELSSSPSAFLLTVLSPNLNMQSLQAAKQIPSNVFVPATNNPIPPHINQLGRQGSSSSFIEIGSEDCDYVLTGDDLSLSGSISSQQGRNTLLDTPASSRKAQPASQPVTTTLAPIPPTPKTSEKKMSAFGFLRSKFDTFKKDEKKDDKKDKIEHIIDVEKIPDLNTKNSPSCDVSRANALSTTTQIRRDSHATLSLPPVRQDNVCGFQSTPLSEVTITHPNLNNNLTTNITSGLHHDGGISFANNTFHPSLALTNHNNPNVFYKILEMLAHRFISLVIQTIIITQQVNKCNLPSISMLNMFVNPSNLSEHGMPLNDSEYALDDEDTLNEVRNGETDETRIAQEQFIANLYKSRDLLQQQLLLWQGSSSLANPQIPSTTPYINESFPITVGGNAGNITHTHQTSNQPLRQSTQLLHLLDSTAFFKGILSPANSASGQDQIYQKQSTLSAQQLLQSSTTPINPRSLQSPSSIGAYINISSPMHSGDDDFEEITPPTGTTSLYERNPGLFQPNHSNTSSTSQSFPNQSYLSLPPSTAASGGYTGNSRIQLNEIYLSPLSNRGNHSHGSTTQTCFASPVLQTGIKQSTLTHPNNIKHHSTGYLTQLVTPNHVLLSYQQQMQYWSHQMTKTQQEGQFATILHCMLSFISLYQPTMNDLPPNDDISALFSTVTGSFGSGSPLPPTVAPNPVTSSHNPKNVSQCSLQQSLPHQYVFKTVNGENATLQTSTATPQAIPQAIPRAINTPASSAQGNVCGSQPSVFNSSRRKSAYNLNNNVNEDSFNNVHVNRLVLDQNIKLYHIYQEIYTTITTFINFYTIFFRSLSTKLIVYSSLEQEYNSILQTQHRNYQQYLRNSHHHAHFTGASSGNNYMATQQQQQTQFYMKNVLQLMITKTLFGPNKLLSDKRLVNGVVNSILTTIQVIKDISKQLSYACYLGSPQYNNLQQKQHINTTMSILLLHRTLQSGVELCGDIPHDGIKSPIPRTDDTDHVPLLEIDEQINQEHNQQNNVANFEKRLHLSQLQMGYSTMSLFSSTRLQTPNHAMNNNSVPPVEPTIGESTPISSTLTDLSTTPSLIPAKKVLKPSHLELKQSETKPAPLTRFGSSKQLDLVSPANSTPSTTSISLKRPLPPSRQPSLANLHLHNSSSSNLFATLGMGSTVSSTAIGSIVPSVNYSPSLQPNFVALASPQHQLQPHISSSISQNLNNTRNRSASLHWSLHNQYDHEDSNPNAPSSTLDHGSCSKQLIHYEPRKDSVHGGTPGSYSVIGSLNNPQNPNASGMVPNEYIQHLLFPHVDPVEFNKTTLATQITAQSAGSNTSTNTMNPDILQGNPGNVVYQGNPTNLMTHASISSGGIQYDLEIPQTAHLANGLSSLTSTAQQMKHVLNLSYLTSLPIPVLVHPNLSLPQVLSPQLQQYLREFASNESGDIPVNQTKDLEYTLCLTMLSIIRLCRHHCDDLQQHLTSSLVELMSAMDALKEVLAIGGILPLAIQSRLRRSIAQNQGTNTMLVKDVDQLKRYFEQKYTAQPGESLRDRRRQQLRGGGTVATSAVQARKASFTGGLSSSLTSVQAPFATPLSPKRNTPKSFFPAPSEQSPTLPKSPPQQSTVPVTATSHRQNPEKSTVDIFSLHDDFDSHIKSLSQFANSNEVVSPLTVNIRSIGVSGKMEDLVDPIPESTSTAERARSGSVGVAADETTLRAPDIVNLYNFLTDDEDIDITDSAPPEPEKKKKLVHVHIELPIITIIPSSCWDSYTYPTFLATTITSTIPTAAPPEGTTPTNDNGFETQTGAVSSKTNQIKCRHVAMLPISTLMISGLSLSISTFQPHLATLFSLSPTLLFFQQLINTSPYPVFSVPSTYINTTSSQLSLMRNSNVFLRILGTMAAKCGQYVATQRAFLQSMNNSVLLQPPIQTISTLPLVVTPITHQTVYSPHLSHSQPLQYTSTDSIYFFDHYKHFISLQIQAKNLLYEQSQKNKQKQKQQQARDQLKNKKKLDLKTPVKRQDKPQPMALKRTPTANMAELSNSRPARRASIAPFSQDTILQASPAILGRHLKTPQVQKSGQYPSLNPTNSEQMHLYAQLNGVHNLPAPITGPAPKNYPSTPLLSTINSPGVLATPSTATALFTGLPTMPSGNMLPPYPKPTPLHHYTAAPGLLQQSSIGYQPTVHKMTSAGTVLYGGPHHPHPSGIGMTPQPSLQSGIAPQPSIGSQNSTMFLLNYNSQNANLNSSSIFNPLPFSYTFSQRELTYYQLYQQQQYVLSDLYHISSNACYNIHYYKQLGDDGRYDTDFVLHFLEQDDDTGLYVTCTNINCPVHNSPRGQQAPQAQISNLTSPSQTPQRPRLFSPMIHNSNNTHILRQQNFAPPIPPQFAENNIYDHFVSTIDYPYDVLYNCYGVVCQSEQQWRKLLRFTNNEYQTLLVLYYNFIVSQHFNNTFPPGGSSLTSQIDYNKLLSSVNLNNVPTIQANLKQNRHTLLLLLTADGLSAPMNRKYHTYNSHIYSPYLNTNNSSVAVANLTVPTLNPQLGVIASPFEHNYPMVHHNSTCRVPFNDVSRQSRQRLALPHECSYLYYSFPTLFNYQQIDPIHSIISSLDLGTNNASNKIYPASSASLTRQLTIDTQLAQQQTAMSPIVGPSFGGGQASRPTRSILYSPPNLFNNAYYKNKTIETLQYNYVSSPCRPTLRSEMWYILSSAKDLHMKSATAMLSTISNPNNITDYYQLLIHTAQQPINYYSHVRFEICKDISRTLTSHPLFNNSPISIYCPCCQPSTDYLLNMNLKKPTPSGNAPRLDNNPLSEDSQHRQSSNQQRPPFSQLHLSSSGEQAATTDDLVNQGQTNTSPVLTIGSHRSILGTTQSTLPHFIETTHIPIYTQAARLVLERILSAYAMRIPEVGYCQGMNILVGVLITQCVDIDEALKEWRVKQMGLYSSTVPLYSTNYACSTTKDITTSSDGTESDMESIHTTTNAPSPHTNKYNAHSNMYYQHMVCEHSIQDTVSVLTFDDITITEGEQRAFFILCALIESRIGYYSKSMSNVKLDQRILCSLLEYYDPQLSLHLSMYHIGLDFTIPWLMCLFVYNPFSLDMSLKVWDYYFYYNSSSSNTSGTHSNEENTTGNDILLLVILYILIQHRNIILSLDTTEDILYYLLQLSNTTFNITLLQSLQTRIYNDNLEQSSINSHSHSPCNHDKEVAPSTTSLPQNQDDITDKYEPFDITAIHNELVRPTAELHLLYEKIQKTCAQFGYITIETYQSCRRHNDSIEFIMKDLSLFIQNNVTETPIVKERDNDIETFELQPHSPSNTNNINSTPLPPNSQHFQLQSSQKNLETVSTLQIPPDLIHSSSVEINFDMNSPVADLFEINSVDPRNPTHLPNTSLYTPSITPLRLHQHTGEGNGIYGAHGDNHFSLRDPRGSNANSRHQSGKYSPPPASKSFHAGGLTPAKPFKHQPSFQSPDMSFPITPNLKPGQFNPTAPLPGSGNTILTNVTNLKHGKDGNIPLINQNTFTTPRKSLKVSFKDDGSGTSIFDLYPAPMDDSPGTLSPLTPSSPSGTDVSLVLMNQNAPITPTMFGENSALSQYVNKNGQLIGSRVKQCDCSLLHSCDIKCSCPCIYPELHMEEYVISEKVPDQTQQTSLTKTNTTSQTSSNAPKRSPLLFPDKPSPVMTSLQMKPPNITPLILDTIPSENNTHFPTTTTIPMSPTNRDRRVMFTSSSLVNPDLPQNNSDAFSIASGSLNGDTDEIGMLYNPHSESVEGNARVIGDPGMDDTLKIIYIDVYEVIAKFLTPSFLSLISSLKQHHIPLLLHDTTQQPPSQLCGKDKLYQLHNNANSSPYQVQSSGAILDHYTQYLIRAYTYFLHHHTTFHGTPHTWSIYMLSALPNHILFTQAFVPFVFPEWHRSLFTPHNGINSPVFSRLFILFDRSRCGSVNFADFLYSTIIFRFKTCLVERLKLCFLFCDLDGDGIVSIQDLSFALVMLYRLYFGAVYTTFEDYLFMSNLVNDTANTTQMAINNNHLVANNYLKSNTAANAIIPTLWPCEENISTAPFKTHFGHSTEYNHRIVSYNNTSHGRASTLQGQQQQQAPSTNSNNHIATNSTTSINDNILNISVYTSRMLYQFYKHNGLSNAYLFSTFLPKQQQNYPTNNRSQPPHQSFSISSSPLLIVEPLANNSTTNTLLSSHLATVVNPQHSSNFTATGFSPHLLKNKQKMIKQQLNNMTLYTDVISDAVYTNTKVQYDSGTTNVNHCADNVMMNKELVPSVFNSGLVDLSILHNIAGESSSMHTYNLFSSISPLIALSSSSGASASATSGKSSLSPLLISSSNRFIQPMFNTTSSLLPSHIAHHHSSFQQSFISQTSYNGNSHGPSSLGGGFFKHSATTTLGFSFHEFMYVAAFHPLLSLFFNLNIAQPINGETTQMQLTILLESLYKAHTYGSLYNGPISNRQYSGQPSSTQPQQQFTSHFR